MKIRRTGWAAIVAGAAAVAAVAWAFAPRPLEVELAGVTRGTFESAIEEDGKTRLHERYVLAAPIAGVLTRVTLREGDEVAAGAVVATLLPVLPPLQDARTRRELQLGVAAARAAADQAQAQVGVAEVALARAASELARSEELMRNGYVALNKYDADRLAAQSAARQLDSARESRRVAGMEVERAQAALAVVERGAGSGLALRAPASGRVLRIAQGSETPVAAGAAILEIGDTRELEVVAELLTADALQAAPGSRVVIERWGGSEPLAGRVRRVEPGAFTKVSALGVEEQRVRVVIDLESPLAQRQALGDGYRVGVRIVTLARADALRVPVSALFPLPGNGAGKAAEVPGAMGVFTVDGGRARLRAVDIAGRNGSEAWVRNGLEVGERVIVYAPAQLQDGGRVRERKT
jgi:HlyD family secretion protein